MAKIAQVAAKYLITAEIEIEGTVDKPDMIGAIFGQTEGLLGSDLELRELQRSGRIGRIEVTHEIKNGKTFGTITVPSSLDKTETAIVGAAMETIQRIGPCNAKIKVTGIEDVRISKRAQVLNRAKELLKGLMDTSMSDSGELSQEVSESVKVMGVVEITPDRLAAGPDVQDSSEIIVVEGRADVVNLLKHGIKNAVAMNGTSVPQGIIDLCKDKKEVTVLVDGDRGGDLIIRELLSVAKIDFVTKAPDGKEVEELQMKEIHKALRSRIPADQAKAQLTEKSSTRTRLSSERPERMERRERPSREHPRMREERPSRPLRINPDQKETFKNLLTEQLGSKAASILDHELNVLGKIPVAELVATVKSLNSGIYAIVLDGDIDRDIAEAAERSHVRFLVGTEAKVHPVSARVMILTQKDLE